jgi:hypothetical protein
VRTKRLAAFGLLALLAGSELSFGIMGCLRSIETLVPRSSVVVVGRILEVGRTEIEPCPEPTRKPCPRPVGSGEPPPPADRLCPAAPYFACGTVWKLNISVDRILRGKVRKKIEVFVALPAFKVSCDDRPPVERMKGLRALFLSSTVGAVSGPSTARTACMRGGEAFRYLEVMNV